MKGGKGSIATIRGTEKAGLPGSKVETGGWAALRDASLLILKGFLHYKIDRSPFHCCRAWVYKPFRIMWLRPRTKIILTVF